MTSAKMWVDFLGSRLSVNEVNLEKRAFADIRKIGKASDCTRFLTVFAFRNRSCFCPGQTPDNQVCFFSEPYYQGQSYCANSAGSVRTGFRAQSISIAGRYEVKITRSRQGASRETAGLYQYGPYLSKIISMNVDNTHKIRWDQRPGINQSAAVGQGIWTIEIRVRTASARTEKGRLNRQAGMMNLSEASLDTVQDMSGLFANTEQAKAVLGPLAEVAELRQYMLDKAAPLLSEDQRARLYLAERVVAQACNWLKAATNGTDAGTQVCNWLTDPVQTQQIKRWANNRSRVLRDASPVTVNIRGQGLTPVTDASLFGGYGRSDCRDRQEAIGASGYRALTDGITHFWTEDEFRRHVNQYINCTGL